MRNILPTFATLLLSTVLGLAGTVSLTPIQDATLIDSDDGSLADARGPHLRAGRTSQGAGSTRRALLTFDVASTIPRGARIVDATLILYKSGGSSTAVELTLHRVRRDWGEGSSSFAGGQGVPATPGDATWLHRFHNPAAPDDSPSWHDPGGDFDAAASAVATVGETGYYAWSDPRMIDDLERWREGPSHNPGWVLVGDESAGGSVKRLDSRDNTTAAQRPLLLVEYIRGNDDEDEDEDD